jgi:hypothetical protein
MNAPTMPKTTEVIEMLQKLIYYTEPQEWATALELIMLNIFIYAQY